MDETLFASAADIKLRLDNTIVRYKGKAYHCRNTGTSEVLSLTLLSDEQTKPINIGVGDPNLDISSPPLGFLNYDRHCVYYSRIPQRKYKQGLSSDGIQVRSLHGRAEKNKEHITWSSRLGDTIRGRFPTFHSCFTRATAGSGTYSQAFNRHFAIEKIGVTGDIHLHHKFQIIGTFDRKKRFFDLIPTYDNMYTRRLLHKHGVLLDESKF